MCTVAVTAWTRRPPPRHHHRHEGLLRHRLHGRLGRPSAAAADPGRLFSYLLCLSAFIASSLRTLCGCNSLCGAAPRNRPRLPSAGAERAVRVGLKWNTAITRPSQPGSSKCGEARGQERTRVPHNVQKRSRTAQNTPIQVNESAAVLRPFSRSRGLPPEHGSEGQKAQSICRPRDLTLMRQKLSRIARALAMRVNV